MSLAIAEFRNYEESVPQALDELGAGAVLAEQKSILIKPNLVNASPFPVTTHPKCCEAIIKYAQRHTQAGIVIAEGSGAAEMETDEIFEALGYVELSRRCGVPLIDLNIEPTLVVKNPGGEIFREFHLPRILFGCFIISVPVLKAHSFSVITGSLKNMMGALPPGKYQQSGHWKKASFHAHMHQSIIELNRCVTPHLTVLDASVGLADFHLGGKKCSPPVNKIVAGFDPLEVDRKAAELLGLDWQKIPHLAGER